MKSKQVVIISIMALLGLGAGAYIMLAEKPVSAEDGHGGGAPKEEVVKGPNRGRLLSDPDFQIEMTIFETGVPPIFRAFAFDGKKPIDPSEVTLVVSVHRLGGQVDTVRFQKEADYLTGDKVVGEPHSFTVKVKADWKEKSHAWVYTQLEGRLQLSREALQSSGVKIVKAGPATIRTVLALNGKIVPNEDKMMPVRARFPGVVREARKRLGDVVKKGDVLAVVESNESLQPYEVRSQMAGTVIERNAAVGESVTDNQTLYSVADLGSVWVDMSVYRKDFSRLRRGQIVKIDAGDGGETVGTSIT